MRRLIEACQKKWFSKKQQKSQDEMRCKVELRGPFCFYKVFLFECLNCEYSLMLLLFGQITLSLLV